MSVSICEDEVSRLKQEVDALRFIFSDDGEMVLNDELEQWLRQPAGEVNPGNLCFRVLLGERRFYSMNLYLEITLDPENNYKSGLKQMSVVSSKALQWGSERPFFLSESQFNYIVCSGMKAFVPNTECIYDQVIASREATEEIVRDIPCEVYETADSEMQLKSSESDSEDSDFEQEEISKYIWNAPETSRVIRWGQRACYSHHIRNKIKRRLIVEWAKELSLGGYCKIGYPGIIIVEGPEECCLEYIRRLQRLRWKHFIVRGEIIQDISLDQKSLLKLKEAINSLRVLPSTMIELPADGMKVLAKICEDLGIKDLFLTTMKIYSK
ncbi:YSHH motif-containing protein [Cryptosporidium canis]|uniref:YSHH motif-containing protein n=1 Tax=Cryptosporidium canis TaxID=195482 RepID=A0A9D5DK56_9CRYT|nr:YSHH motif-containing protein [Cryptosporidium canis]